MEKLTQYNQKRNFQKTIEPKGKSLNEENDCLFVIQHHLARREHYDFRLAWNGVLLSWAVPKGPSFNPDDKRLAVHVEDHPLNYRDFEGNIPEGEYGGGVVRLFDEGQYEPLNDFNEGMKKGSLKFILQGQRLQGKWTLIKMDEPNWLLRKENDQFASSKKKITSYKKSIKTGRTVSEIKKEIKKNPFQEIDVKKAKLATYLPHSAEWIYEIKYDGYRIIAFIENQKIRLMTRNNNDYQKKFPEIVASLIKLSNGRPMILDGEVVVFTNKDGKTDFQALQNHLKERSADGVSYVVFDILALDGQDLRNKTLMERKEILSSLLKKTPRNLCYSAHIDGNKNFDFASFSQRGYEGLVCKKKSSFYNSLRNEDWIKVKCYNRQEFVIAGYTPSDNKSFKSLILGYYQERNLVYAGRCGTGFTVQGSFDLYQKLQKLIRKTCPFANNFKEKKDNIVWLKPALIAEIQFAEWTKDNLLRQASFKGLRQDKNNFEVIKEENKQTKNITISNPDKVIFTNPKLTKQEIVDYYLKVAKRMLPHLTDRILSVVNCPQGIKGKSFFKKHPQSSKNFKTIKLQDAEKEYFYIAELNDLLVHLQHNTIEFHIWGSKINQLEKPSTMVFDLDPDEKMEIKKVRQGVLDLKRVLDELNLKAFLKTSGNKGYHVVVPFKSSNEWDSFKQFAKKIALVMEQRWPDRYTSNIRKDKRKGKIFIDWLRNSRGATSVAPYSLRAKEGAKVSMPISWNELEKVKPDSIDFKEAIRRSKLKDPWSKYFTIEQELLPANNKK